LKEKELAMKRFGSVKTVFVIAAIIGLALFIGSYSLAGDSLSATHVVSVSGGEATITTTIEYDAAVTALDVQVNLPDGWSYLSDSGSDEPAVEPKAGSVGTIDFAWIMPPASPLIFNYTVSVPEGSGAGEIDSAVLYRIGSGKELSEVVTLCR